MKINYKAKLFVHARRGLLLACSLTLRGVRDQVAGVPRRLFRKLAIVFKVVTPPLSTALLSGLYKGLCNRNLQSLKEMETTSHVQWFPFADKTPHNAFGK